MSFTYVWYNAAQEAVIRYDANGKAVSIPADPANRDYAEFLASGETAADYVPPEPEPAPVLTAEQKLEAAGLTVAELKDLLGLA